MKVGYLTVELWRRMTVGILVCCWRADREKDPVELQVSTV